MFNTFFFLAYFQNYLIYFHSALILKRNLQQICILHIKWNGDGKNVREEKFLHFS